MRLSIQAVSSIFFLLFFTSICFATSAVHQHKKPVIADTAEFLINNEIPLTARIDSGASRSSVNAQDIVVKDANKKMKKNVGKQINFDLVNGNGKHYAMQSTILAVKTIKTPQGKEFRYLVPLTFTWNGKSTKVEVNLRDRSNLEFKLLIGRDWLNDNAVIDVAPKSMIAGVADFIINDDFSLTARVDTGAASTSINATNISVTNASKKMTNNIGKIVSFDVTNKDGKVKHISTPIEQVVEISNAIAAEYRYKVKLKIQWNDRIQMLSINLKDRSKLTYKMLIGRDWLSTNAIVDTNL
jgi:hypothetical protein